MTDAEKTALAGREEKPPPNLEKLYPRYKIRMSEDHVKGEARDPWNFELLCSRWKARVYPHGDHRLQAWITTARIPAALAELEAAGATPHQVASHPPIEATVIFDLKDAEKVLKVLRPKKKRAGDAARLKRRAVQG